MGPFEGKMTRKEAALILGAVENDKDNVLLRYRQMMKINHPDRGGSAFISSKVNEAKDLLLQDDATEGTGSKHSK